MASESPLNWPEDSQMTMRRAIPADKSQERRQVLYDLAKARNQVSQNLIASGRGAAFQLVKALEKGDHVGLLVDQKFRKGIQVPFFGKNAPTNTLLAKLARRYNCPVHGARQ